LSCSRVPSRTSRDADGGTNVTTVRDAAGAVDGVTRWSGMARMTSVATCTPTDATMPHAWRLRVPRSGSGDSNCMTAIYGGIRGPRQWADICSCADALICLY
jgi:hypothetical protein